MKNVLIAFSFITVFFVSTAFDTREDISWLNGQWIGLGYQPNTETRWSISLEADTDKRIFLINYPSISCRGKWKIVSADVNRIVFREKITEGIENCIPTGTVVVTKVDDNHISYSYFEKIEGKLILGSFSTLIKVL
jgi:hypothetical protein